MRTLTLSGCAQNTYKANSMSKRTYQLLPVTCLVTGALWAVNDPFVGKWKLNPSKSRFPDEMKVKTAGANRYAFDFGAGSPETIVADGTDQPGISGPPCRSPSRGPTLGKSSARKVAARSLRGYGNFPKTARRSATPLHLSSPTDRRSVWTMYTRGQRGLRACLAHGKAQARK